VCLSDAGPVVALDGHDALVDLTDGRRRVSLAPLVLDGGRVAAGDWVLVHTGFAVAVVDATEGGAIQALNRSLRVE
jgi:hydrogenase expression/formation protein HypC